jgi:hypothetical protein
MASKKDITSTIPLSDLRAFFEANSCACDKTRGGETHEVWKRKGGGRGTRPAIFPIKVDPILSKVADRHIRDMGFTRNDFNQWIQRRDIALSAKEKSLEPIKAERP